MRSAEPASSCRLTLPVAGFTPTVTRLGLVCPATKFRLDALGIAPLGHTVTWLAMLGLVTVTFITTADTPDAGTPPRPVTCSERVTPPLNGVAVVPLPVRESMSRAGVSGKYAPCDVSGVAFASFDEVGPTLFSAATV